MTVEFELTLNSNGSPCIIYKHHDRDNSLEQKVLKIFLDGALEKGIVLKSTSGYLECGTNNSWENYEITIKG